MPKWIRFEFYLRHHAVLGMAMGRMYVTYCGRLCAARAIREETGAPRSRCRACASRLKRPYLLPEALLRRVMIVNADFGSEVGPASPGARA